MHVLLSAWRAGFKQTDQRAIFEWAREAVDLPKACYAVPGPFHVEKSRYLIEPLEALMDVRGKQLEYGVPDVCVFVDCGEGRSANEVYFQCVRHGHAEGAKWRCWFALRGTAVDGFRFAPDAGPNAKVPRVLPYSWPPTMADPLLGLKSQDELLAAVLAWQREYHRKALCPVVNWSAAKVKPIAKARRDALAKGKLSYVAAGVSPDFSKHLYSEQFVQRWDTLGHSKWVWERIGKRPNHLWDCYCMGVVAACMAGIIGERIG